MSEEKLNPMDVVRAASPLLNSPIDFSNLPAVVIDPDFPFMDEKPVSAETVRKIVRMNVDRERERCAKIAEGQRRGMPGCDIMPALFAEHNQTCESIAARIRNDNRSTAEVGVIDTVVAVCDGGLVVNVPQRFTKGQVVLVNRRGAFRSILVKDVDIPNNTIWLEGDTIGLAPLDELTVPPVGHKPEFHDPATCRWCQRGLKLNDCDQATQAIVDVDAIAGKP